MIEYQLPPPPPLTEEQRERLKARVVELERQDKQRNNTRKEANETTAHS